MLKNDFFFKKFSIGLNLDVDINEYENFLIKYNKYIKTIYFSIPTSDIKFHSRVLISEQFRNENVIKTFWKQLELIKKYKIELELVFNTYNLDENDIVLAKNILNKKNIEINSLALLDKYYDIVHKHFPNKEYIFSYNNEMRMKKDYERIINKYDYYVIGNANIRNNEFIKNLKLYTQNKTILLINNGCSFNCMWCSKSEFCMKIFIKNLLKNNINYLYAQQSILPFEIHDQIINLEYVDVFKLSTRCLNLSEIIDTIDSYINNDYLTYINESKNNYNLWCRLRPFGFHLGELDINEIIKYKYEIIKRDSN